MRALTLSRQLCCFSSQVKVYGSLSFLSNSAGKVAMIEIWSRIGCA